MGDWAPGVYLGGPSARLLQQLHRPPACALLAPPVVPGEVPTSPPAQLPFEVFWDPPVLHRRPAETEARRGCGETERMFYI